MSFLVSCYYFILNPSFGPPSGGMDDAVAHTGMKSASTVGGSGEVRPTKRRTTQHYGNTWTLEGTGRFLNGDLRSAVNSR